MSTKYLFALLLLVIAVHGTQLAVGDNEEFRRPAFDSIYKISGVALNENITVSLQWGNQTAPFGININIFKVNTTASSAVLTCGTTPNTCTKVFPGLVYTLTSGDYWISLQYDNSGAGLSLLGQSVLVASLTVTGDSATRTSPLLKQTVAIGQYRFHRVYFSTPSTLNAVLPFTDFGQAMEYATPGFLRVFSQAANGNAYFMDSQISPIPAGVDIAALAVTWTYSVPAGYSWIVIDITVHGANSYPSDSDFASFTYAYRLSYATEAYPCPFISDYPDNSGIFRGCAFQSDNSKLPCIVYNTTLAQCVSCYVGYQLVNGKCIENSCPAGYYKKYGQCLQNPTGCDSYNDFAKCLQCSTGYTLANGTCSRTPLTCSGRTFFNSTTWTCDKVDDKCKTWDSNGKCLTCVSNLDKVVNGACVSIESTCTSTQYVDSKGNCVESDVLCSTFEKWGGKCTKCVWGYEISATTGKCVKIICPTRYVPNDYGKCAKVSDLCQTYDAHGVCLTCIPTHTLSASGVCLQLETPNPCPDRQYLGDDNFCHEVSDFCYVYNTANGKCTQCINGYYLMYTGECVIQKDCKSRQVLINNDCHDVSPTCGNFDRTTGKCINCVSDDYELYYGLCIPVETCGARQWTDNSGNCHDVDTKCNTFNPSTGACTSCVQGYNYLNGICCVKGQYNVNGQCVSASSAAGTSNNDGCRTYVNGIGCVRCDSGFTRAQDSLGFYYCQSS